MDEVDISVASDETELFWGFMGGSALPVGPGRQVV